MNDTRPLTRDAFLGGALEIWQPREGYRAGTDAVFLASAVNALEGQSVLELGCGAGVAALCLAKRVSGAKITGLEIQPFYADLARRNALENALTFNVVEGDVAEMPTALKSRNFDHVIANPPYYLQDATTPPRDKGKMTAHVADLGALGAWVDEGIKRLAPKGIITLIHRAEALGEVLGALQPRCGKIEIFPITSRAGRVASRVVVSAQKGAASPLEMHFPRIVHRDDVHLSDAKDYSEWADGILRNGNGFAT